MGYTTILLCAAVVFTASCATVDTKSEGLIMKHEYGFRHDPMKYVRDGTDLNAALVRRLLSVKPLPGDGKLLEEHCREAFSKMREDGSFESEHDKGLKGPAGGSIVLSLLEEGYSLDRPEINKAIGYLESELQKLPVEEYGDICTYAVTVLCLAGKGGHPAIKATLEKTAADMPKLVGAGCPGTPCVQLTQLWAGREIADVGEALDFGLDYLDRHLTPAACSKELGLLEPIALINMVAMIDHPGCQSIAEKLIMHLVRGQTPDGGWGWNPEQRGSNVGIFRMLKKYDLIRKLAHLPPTPQDWDISRCIKVPFKSVAMLFYRNGVFWVLDMDDWAAVAFSPAGKEVKRVPLEKKIKPDGMFANSFGPWDDDFALALGRDVKRLYRLDGETGRIEQEAGIEFIEHFADGVRKDNDSILICDGFEGIMVKLPADDLAAKPEYFRVASGMPSFACLEGEDIWVMDHFVNAIVKSTRSGELLDWGSPPFWLGGLAHDGEQLWALDLGEKRICALDKSESGRKLPVSY